MPSSRKTSLYTAPGFQQRLGELSRRSDLIWLVSLAIGLTCTLVAAYLFPASPSGKFWAYAAILLRSSLYLWSGERLKGNGGEIYAALFGVGAVAGSFELLVDWGLIHWVKNGRLVYLSGNDVVLLGSPVWMPLAWAGVVVELGYPSLRLFGLFRRRLAIRSAALLASLLTGAAAFVTIGFYEFFAYRAGWWKYEHAHLMLGEFCALYIPLGEFFMFLAILPILAWVLAEKQAERAARIEGGIVFAVAIGLGYTLSYLLLEAGR